MANPKQVFFTCNKCTKLQCFGSNKDFYVSIDWGVVGFSSLSNHFVHECVMLTNFAQVTGQRFFSKYCIICSQAFYLFISGHHDITSPNRTIWRMEKIHSYLFPLSNLQEIKWWATIQRFYSSHLVDCSVLSTLYLFLPHASLILVFLLSFLRYMTLSQGDTTDELTVSAWLAWSMFTQTQRN